MSSGKSSDYREKEDGDMERVVWEGMDVLGASVSKMTILKMVSVATDQKVLKIVDSVDEAIDNLIGKGLVCKQNGKYQIVNNKV
ncbi:uncharacterized protein LOC108145756 isoform X2 [Drosophila elegans]|uniref:uncharacterized protein LOC108145756 isoform X2 n=1 Tax=Drosophila elegans TaxID=30023 RepID=UPI0007E77FB9|nr:uncharacterized protein LOC108145756 isoform X2 [Drosophila elegans]